MTTLGTLSAAQTKLNQLARKYPGEFADDTVCVQVDRAVARLEGQGRACRDDSCDGNHCPICGGHKIDFFAPGVCSTCDVELRCSWEARQPPRPAPIPQRKTWWENRPELGTGGVFATT